MDASIFTAIVATMTFCASGAPVVDGKCGDAPASKVEMHLLTGPLREGSCMSTFECAGDVAEIIRIERDGKVLLAVPASAIDRDTLDKLWMALKPMYEHSDLAK